MPASLPPGLALYQLSVGHYVSRALNLAAELELADQLEAGPRDCRELARAVEAHAPSLKRVMRLLASVGVFEELEDGRFGLTPMADLLRADAEGSMQSMVKVFSGTRIQDSWKELEYCVRTGEPAFRKHSPDADPFAQMGEDPEAAAVFDKAMATFAPQPSQRSRRPTTFQGSRGSRTWVAETVRSSAAS